MACPHVSGLAAIAYESNPTAESMSAADRWDLVSAKNATNEVTSLPTSPESDNLIFLSPFIDPTPAPPPTPAPTDAPTTTTTPGGALAVGDPHLQNLRGERFDLMKTGKHVLINIPRGMSAETCLLRVQADAVRMGGHCADMYFQDVNVTGSWAEAKQAGGLHYSVSQQDVKTPGWTAFGKVELKVVHGHTHGGLLYLNLYVKHLSRAGHAVGGLLGEDDHEEVSTPAASCAHHVALVVAGDF